VQDLDAVEVSSGLPSHPQAAAAGQTAGPASLQAAKNAVRRQGPYVPATTSTVAIREELQALLAELDTRTLAEAKAKLGRKIAAMPMSTTGQTHYAQQQGEEEYDEGGDY
jgi:hypothetical protein